MTQAEALERLTPAWKPMRYHAGQEAFWSSKARFPVGCGGRRSGKTIIAKRKTIKRALAFTNGPGRFCFFTPTRDQGKEIYWNQTGESLLELVPSWAIAEVLETSLTVRLRSGIRLQVMGMDKPMRAEGSPIDGAVIDEFAAMKPEAWTRSIRPSLSTPGREGWAMFIGKPVGRNHFYDLCKHAQVTPDWEFFTWPSSALLAPEELESAKQSMDELSFAQEYEASFVSFTGRAYYAYEEAFHAEHGLRAEYYDSRVPLQVCFDFNVEPGVAAMGQEVMHLRHGQATAWLGEVWIPLGSTTEAVCRRIIKDWGKHEGEVYVWGDATGGNRHSSAPTSDIAIIRKMLRSHFGQRLHMRFNESNPLERDRVNAVNSRLRSMDGRIHMLVDPKYAPHVMLDFEGVRVLEGGSGELDKRHTGGNKDRTHISDALGYYVASRFPILRHRTQVSEIALR